MKRGMRSEERNGIRNDRFLLLVSSHFHRTGSRQSEIDRREIRYPFTRKVTDDGVREVNLAYVLLLRSVSHSWMFLYM